MNGSTPRGLEVSDKPASSASLTEYPRERGKGMGYSRTITFYSIRRRIATDLTEQVGPDHARRIMGHSAGGRKSSGNRTIHALDRGNLRRQQQLAAAAIFVTTKASTAGTSGGRNLRRQHFAIVKLT
ncbi:hypothetical protein V501_07654 [Pseudogymnoascus sp. VKM F-4519 (FW-2642)]|nr:hypothetical protein V501_07654 [Pseudogymnoascus sp. VKM F-4519 (FW-2642)]